LSLLRRWLVNKLTLAVALAALTALSACKKTGEGQYEVQKPVIGTESDTVNTPSVETGTVKDTVTVPTVGTEKKEVNLPKVEVNEPKE
jgi:outer membrane protein assembly factor BamE (lipoprotein component of BamABCDE complex)